MLYSFLLPKTQICWRFFQHTNAIKSDWKKDQEPRAYYFKKAPPKSPQNKTNPSQTQDTYLGSFHNSFETSTTTDNCNNYLPFLHFNRVKIADNVIGPCRSVQSFE